jgi:hypothetical protein
MHGSGLTDLVGREEELELLLRRWSKAKSGEGQVVLLGDRQVSTDGCTARTHCCGATHALALLLPPQHTDSALYPIISQMERAAGFTHNDTAQAVKAKRAAGAARALTADRVRERGLPMCHFCGLQASHDWAISLTFSRSVHCHLLVSMVRNSSRL